MAITFNRNPHMGSYKFNGHLIQDYVVLQVSKSGTLPLTITNSLITANNTVAYIDVDYSKITGDLTVTTSDGSLTISGTASSSTSYTVYLYTTDSF